MVSSFALAMASYAHFPFVVTGDDGTGRVVFSETLEPDDEVSLDLLKGLILQARNANGRDTAIQPVASPQWLDIAIPADTSLIHGTADLGFVQRGTGVPHVLIYHAKAIIGNPFAASATLGDVPVEIVPVRVEGGLKLKLVAEGNSVGERNIRVIMPDGIQEECDIDADGLTTTTFSRPGKYGAWARHWLDKPGQRDGKDYTQERHYATIVFDFEMTAHSSSTLSNVRASNLNVQTAPFRLPQTLASFGAVALDGYLYVFGGHVIDRHEYHTEAVTGYFRRIKLDGSSTWEDLPGSPVGMQGMNLAAHDGKIYRLGGMQPRNAPGEAADNISLAELVCFDPASRQWSTLSAPPHGRSSHDVAVVGGKLYALGGWKMKGKGREESWLDKTDVLDLANPSAGWSSLEQPWSRRALIVAATDSRIYVMGVIDEHDDIHTRVDVLNTQDGTWSRGPDIPGPARNGFAPAASVVDGRLYLSVPSGELYRLNEQGDQWELITKTTPRQVHRMVASDDRLYLIGGAMGGKMTDLVEIVELPAEPNR